MKKLCGIALFFFLLVVCPSAFGQNSRAYGFCTPGSENITLQGLTPQSYPPGVMGAHAGCTVTVYNAGTMVLATIFSNKTGTVLGNPFTADTTTGYWFFYAANGTEVDVTISGASLPSSFTYGDILIGASGGGGGGSPVGNPGDIQILASPGVFGSGVAGTANVGVSGNIARKVAVGDAMQFVSTSGNDSNDGLSWGTAKLTVMAGYDALPASGGTVAICSSSPSIPVPSTATPGQGIWLAGTLDPNYSSLPTGWRQAKSVSFIGECGNTSFQAGHIPTVSISGGSATAPWIRLSSSNQTNVDFENLHNQYPEMNVQIGVDSNGAQTDNSGWVGANFENITTLDCNSCGSTVGPGWFIGGGDTFNIFMDHVTAQGNGNATPGADNQAAILVKPTSGSSAVGLAVLSNAELAGGGFKFYAGGNSSGFNLEHVYSEDIVGGSAGVATVWVANGQASQVQVYDISTADASGTTYDLRNDTPAGFAATVVALGSFSGGVKGPVTFAGAVGDGSVAGDPNVQSQTGFSFGRAYGFLGNTQRQFSPTAVRYTNLAPTAPGGWSFTGGGTTTFTTGITAPDGTVGAAQVTSSGGGEQDVILYTASLSIAVGQYFIGGFWERSTAGTEFLDFSANNNVTVIGSGDTISCSRLLPPFFFTAEWVWTWEACQVTAAPTTPATVSLSAFFSSTVPLQLYAPIMLNVAASTLSTDEIFQLAQNLSSYDSACVVGTVCGLRGQGGTQSGTTTMSGGTKTITFAMPYTNTPNCTASDVTAIAGVQITPAATTLVLATSGSSDVVNWICRGNPN